MAAARAITFGKLTPRSGWEDVTNIASYSELDKSYEIKRHLGTGRLGCACPSYRFKRGDVNAKTCKHLDAYRSMSVTPTATPVRVEFAGESFRVHRRAINFEV